MKLIQHYCNYGALKTCCFAAIIAMLSGCAGLLPHSKEDVRTPWNSYAEARALFDSIIVNSTTTDQLKALGVNAQTTPNVAILSHADLLRKITAGSSLDIRLLDTELQSCLMENKTCVAYELEQKHLDRKRFGNFWLDFLNFHRRVNITGWQFDAIVVVKHGRVIYKLWSGKPNIQELQEERNPLGPLQGLGGSLLRR